MSDMTTKDIMKALYRNAEMAWENNHTGQSNSANAIYDEYEYMIFADDKQLLEEVERRLKLAEVKGNQGKISPIWHTFKDWNDAPDCECVLVTIENKYGQRFVTDTWWAVDCECRCQWYTNNFEYAEDWEDRDFHLSHNWNVIAWAERIEPFKEEE